MIQIVPLDSTPNQSFNITLAVDGRNLPLTLGFSFNETAGYWVMKITDPTTSTVLLDSIPLLSGGNILGQYAYLGIGAATLVNATGIEMDSPGIDNLGSDFFLLWGDTP